MISIQLDKQRTIIITKTLAPNCINAVDYIYTWISCFRADSDDYDRALIAMRIIPQYLLMALYIPVLLFALFDIYSGLKMREWVLYTGLCKVTLHSLLVTLVS